MPGRRCGKGEWTMSKVSCSAAWISNFRGHRVQPRLWLGGWEAWTARSWAQASGGQAAFERIGAGEGTQAVVCRKAEANRALAESQAWVGPWPPARVQQRCPRPAHAVRCRASRLGGGGRTARGACRGERASERADADTSSSPAVRVQRGHNGRVSALLAGSERRRPWEKREAERGACLTLQRRARATRVVLGSTAAAAHPQLGRDLTSNNERLNDP